MGQHLGMGWRVSVENGGGGRAYGWDLIQLLETVDSLYKRILCVYSIDVMVICQGS